MLLVTEPHEAWRDGHTHTVAGSKRCKLSGGHSPQSASPRSQRRSSLRARYRRRQKRPNVVVIMTDDSAGAISAAIVAAASAPPRRRTSTIAAEGALHNGTARRAAPRAAPRSSPAGSRSAPRFPSWSRPATQNVLTKRRRPSPNSSEERLLDVFRQMASRRQARDLPDRAWLRRDEGLCPYYAGVYAYDDTWKLFHPWFPSFNPDFDKYFSENVNSANVKVWPVSRRKMLAGSPTLGWPPSTRTRPPTPSTTSSSTRNGAQPFFMDVNYLKMHNPTNAAPDFARQIASRGLFGFADGA